MLNKAQPKSQKRTTMSKSARKLTTNTTTTRKIKKAQKKSSVITTGKKPYTVYAPFGQTGKSEAKPHKPQAPDLLMTGPEWDRKALDESPYPQSDRDGNMSDTEFNVTPPFSAEDMIELREETYQRTPLDVRFDNMRKLTALSGIPVFDMGNTHLHIGLQHIIRSLHNDCTTKEHFDLSLEAAHRCMNPELYQQTLDVFKTKGFTPTHEQLLPLLSMSHFRRDPALFDNVMNNIFGRDESKWDRAVTEGVVQFHEIHQQWDDADKVYSNGIARGVLSVPWKHQRQSHINAAKFAQKVPSRFPKWDEPTPEADIIHLDGSPTLLSRAKFRYACYSFQDLCENNDKVHPKINIPHNIVVQSVVRGKNATGGENMYHKLWEPVQAELKAYCRRYGIYTGTVARAANLFWIDHMYFDRLPTPGNQFPLKKPEHRPFKTEGRRALEIKFAIEDAAEEERKQQQIAAALKKPVL